MGVVSSVVLACPHDGSIAGSGQVESLFHPGPSDFVLHPLKGGVSPSKSVHPTWQSPLGHPGDSEVAVSLFFLIDHLKGDGATVESR